MDKKFWIGLVLIIMALFSTVGCGSWYLWWYPRNFEYALKLADDSSLPEQKASYLKEYLQRTKLIIGPPRYVFTRPDLDLEKQRIILAGLIKRFEDIAKLSPSEMAYQQGMFQLTGQEVDHQLERISSIFSDANIRESPLLFFFFWFISTAFWIVGSIVFIWGLAYL